MRQTEFNFPPRVDDIAEVPVEHHEAYVETDDGYVLTDDHAEAVAEGEAAIAEITREHDEAMAKLAGKLAKLDKDIEKICRLKAVRAALLAKVDRKLLKGAVALFLDSHQFGTEITDDGARVWVQSPYGEISVEGATAAWLASQEGEIFLPKRPKELGRFEQELTAIKRRTH